MQIHGLQKLTLTDYPGKTAAIIFSGGCNFRCPYCHNGGLVLHPEQYPMIAEDEIMEFLESRKNILDGVVITGGEPTIQKDLVEFASRIKNTGYCIKLDTNGTRPDMVKTLVENGIIDYVAMDIKNDLDNYPITIGCHAVDIDKVKETITYLLEDHVDYEFRTTVTRELHKMKNMEKIASAIKGVKRYYLQNFRPNENTITKNCHSVPIETLWGFEERLQELGIPAEIRNE